MRVDRVDREDRDDRFRDHRSRPKLGYSKKKFISLLKDDHPKPLPGSIAANEHGQIWNDPKFLGGDGGRYDIQGEAGKNYNLLDDSGLKLNGRFDKFGIAGTAVGETGLTVSGAGGEESKIKFTKDGKAFINGKEMEEGKLYSLADGGTARLVGKKLTVTTAEGYTIEQQAKGWGINLDVMTGAGGVGNGQLPGGLLGQSFDADNHARNGNIGHGAQGEGAITGTVKDYEVSNLFKPDKDENNNNGNNIDGGSGDDTIIIKDLSGGPHNIKGGSGDDTIIIGSDPDEEEESTSPVAANETGKIWGDPHFVGGDGGKYDVQGEAGKIYNLVTDSNLKFRGQFDGWSNGATVVGETGLTVGDMNGKNDHVNFRKDGTARINGKLMQEGKTYELADGGTATLKGNTLTITTGEGYTIQQTTQGSGKKAYINVDVKTGANGVDNGQMPGGLLGQTFDADNKARNGKTGKGAQGEGAIEGNVKDYEANALDPVNDKRSNPSEENDLQSIEDLIKKFLDQFYEKLQALLEKYKPDPDGNQPTHKVDGGSGDDLVKLFSKGKYSVDLGSGDDKAYVDFSKVTNSSATIDGGAGNDTVTLKGSKSDYTMTEDDDGYKTYSDKNGNSVRVASDVENIVFTKSGMGQPMMSE